MTVGPISGTAAVAGLVAAGVHEFRRRPKFGAGLAALGWLALVAIVGGAV